MSAMIYLTVAAPAELTMADHIVAEGAVDVVVRELVAGSRCLRLLYAGTVPLAGTTGCRHKAALQLVRPWTDCKPNKPTSSVFLQSLVNLPCLYFFAFAVYPVLENLMQGAVFHLCALLSPASSDRLTRLLLESWSSCALRGSMTSPKHRPHTADRQQKLYCGHAK